MHPQPVCSGSKHTVVTTGSPVSAGIPCTMVLTAYSALSPATNSFCHRHRRIKGLAGPGKAPKTSADLTPATGARTTRLHRPHQRRSSARRGAKGTSRSDLHKVIELSLQRVAILFAKQNELTWASGLRLNSQPTRIRYVSHAPLLT